VKEENQKHKPEGDGFFNAKDITVSEQQRRLNFTYKKDDFSVLMTDKKMQTKTPNQILEAIKGDKSFMAYIDRIEGTKVYFKESSVTKTALGATDLAKEVAHYKKTGDASSIFETLYLKTGGTEEVENYRYYSLMYSRLTDKERTKWIIQKMPVANPIK
jgi:hypothetical protein